MDNISNKVAHDFCYELYEYDKACREKDGVSGFVRLQEMLQDYSPKTTVKAVLIDLTDRIRDSRG